MTRDQAVSFVRDTLGCDCPDKTLCAMSRETWDNPDIVCHLLREMAPALSALVREVVVVGGTLIVLVCGDLGSDELGIVLYAGVSVRDQLDHNRLRIAYRGKPVDSKIAEKLLAKCDDRVHLHLLGEPRG